MKKKQSFEFEPKIFRSKKFRITAIAILFIAMIVAAVWSPAQKPPEPVALSSVANSIARGQVIKIEDTLLTGELTVYYRNGRTESSLRDTTSPLLEQLTFLGLKGDQLSKVEIKVKNSEALSTSRMIGTLMSIGLVVFLMFMAFRTLAMRNAPSKQKNFEEGKIPAVRFRDVAGIEENVQELRDVVTFLKEGDKYAAMGAKMPRGVLLVGDPGCGKTLVAKAVAGEAGVPFYAISGSEFVEVFAGVGASRVRSLFQKARKRTPCIIFIDEIDAVGRERHSAGSGAEMEQDQTLNQLLVEMDGFDSSENVVVLAATNRLDVLDPALTRAGRFDRRVYVNRPDLKGREAILKVHTQGMKLAEDVYLSNVARATPGLVGADLANIVNEAAISAVRAEHQAITMRDFEEAVEKCLAGGVQRKSQLMTEDERRIIAYHEAGHAIAIHETQLADPVYKITIIPRGQAGGYTISLPLQDSLLHSKNKILARIIGLMGGRAAEEIFFQDITSGASNDLHVATQLAEDMVMRLGMDSSAGLRVFPQAQGYAALAGPRSSQKTIETLDEAVKAILENCYNEARRILTEKRAFVDRVAAELLEVETLSREQFVNLMSSPALAPQEAARTVFANTKLND